jgi:hypothetical protein
MTLDPDRVSCRRRLGAAAAAALVVAACGGETRTLTPAEEGSDFVRVLVEATDGHVDPAPAHE